MSEVTTTTNPRLAALALTLGGTLSGRTFDPSGQVVWTVRGISMSQLLERQIDDSAEMRFVRTYHGWLEALFDQVNAAKRKGLG